MSRWKAKLSHAKNSFKMLRAVIRQQKTSHNIKPCNMLYVMLKLNPSEIKKQFLLPKWSYTLPVITKGSSAISFPFPRNCNKHQSYPSPYVLSTLTTSTWHKRSPSSCIPPGTYVISELSWRWTSVRIEWKTSTYKLTFICRNKQSATTAVATKVSNQCMTF